MAVHKIDQTRSYDQLEERTRVTLLSSAFTSNLKDQFGQGRRYLPTIKAHHLNQAQIRVPHSKGQGRSLG